MSCSITNYNFIFSLMFMPFYKSCYDNCFTTFYRLILWAFTVLQLPVKLNMNLFFLFLNEIKEFRWHNLLNFCWKTSTASKALTINISTASFGIESIPAYFPLNITLEAFSLLLKLIKYDCASRTQRLQLPIWKSWFTVTTHKPNTFKKRANLQLAVNERHKFGWVEV